MQSWEKKCYYIMAVTGALFLIFAGLLLSFDMAIYGDRDYKFYEKEYVKYNVTEDLGMDLADVMEVTEHMMAYLRGNAAELSIMTNVDGTYQDFFNEQDRFHMGEVKELFLGGLKLERILALFGAILLLIAGWPGKKREGIVTNSIFIALGIFFGSFAVIGTFCAVNFSKVFEVFHEIFFDNDLWLFDPATDYMIRMLPEGFFLDMVIRIAVIFAVLLAMILGIACFRRRKMNRNK